MFRGKTKSRRSIVDLRLTIQCGCIPFRPLNSPRGSRCYHVEKDMRPINAESDPFDTRQSNILWFGSTKV